MMNFLSVSIFLLFVFRPSFEETSFLEALRALESNDLAHLILSGKAFEGNEFPARDMEKARRLLRIRLGGIKND